MPRHDRRFLLAVVIALVAAAACRAALADTVTAGAPGAEQVTQAAASRSLLEGSNDGSLAPAERVAVAWGAYENDTAFCQTWDAAATGNWVNDTASGPHAQPQARQRPSDDAFAAATQQLCSASPSTALGLFTQAVGQGGSNASSMLMAVSLGECPNNQTMPVSLSDFSKVPELHSAATVLRYIDGFVGACTDLGFSACVTVAALNGTSNATVLVDQEQRWAGQEAVRPRPSWPTVKPPAGFNSTEETWALGVQAQCVDYNTTTGKRHNGTLYVEREVWDVGVARLVEEKGAEICRLGSEAVPLLLAAFRAGGADAKLALAGVQQAGLNNDSCNAIAFGAFEAAVKLNSNSSVANLTDYRLVRDNIIAAAEEIGLAACVTSVYTNGSAAAVEQRHAGVASQPDAPAAPSTPSDGYTGNGKLALPDYPGGQTMQLYFDVKPTVQCKVWDSKTLTFVPEGDPKEANEYLNLPDEAAYQELGRTVCMLGASAAPLLEERFYAGGDAAVLALAALTQTTCSDASAKQAAVDAFWNSTSVWNATNTMRLVQNVVQAAHEIGLPACFTAVVLNRTGGVVDQEMRWTEGRLPAGDVRTMWKSGEQPQQCSEWDGAAGDFVNGSGPAWPAGSGAKPTWSEIKDFADRMCPLKGGAAPMLLAALDAGGKQAAVAVAALKSYGACVDDQARQDAFDALTNSPQLSNQTVVMRYVHRYIQACGDNGIACCTTVAVVDPTAKQALYTKQVHTSNSTAAGGGGTGGPQPTPSPVGPPPQPEPDGGGVSAGAVAGAVVGVLAALACGAGLVVWLRRRRKQQVAASTAAAATTDPKLNSRAGVASTQGGAASGLYDLDEDAAAAEALATVPTKPSGSTPASLASLLQSLEEMEGGGAAYSASAEDAYLLSYVTSLASQPGGFTDDSPAKLRRASSAAQQLRPWEVDFRDVRLLRCVGAGSFGRVFLGEWHQTAVAVKLLLRGGGQAAAGIGSLGDARQVLELPPQVLQKLDEEAGLLASLRHNNVVNFYGVCHSPPCIITEFCERGSLADLLARGRQDPAAAAALPWPRRLSMALDAARGMLYLHSRPVPVLHRDLKSPNLLVDAHFRAKVTDLNLSRLLGDTQHTTAAAVLNPRWLPPEIMRGGRASKAADVFAYGVVLWELLTWQLPWSHEQDPWRIVSSVLAGERLEVPTADRLPGMPAGGPPEGLDEYIALLRRCWAQDPEQRPAYGDIIPELRALLLRAGGGAGADGGTSSGGATGGASGSMPSATASPTSLSGGSGFTASS